MTESAKTEAPTTCKCLRCGRALRSATSVAAGYGPTCKAKVAAAAKTSTEKPTQVAKALELIEVGGIVPVHRGRAFRVVSSKGDATYLTAREACSCPAGLKGRYGCYHRTAVELLLARPAATHTPIAA